MISDIYTSPPVDDANHNIAPKQDTNTASELIPVGKYFINADGDLCQCDIQIASGGAITVGTNCHVVPDGLANEIDSHTIIKTANNGDDINTNINPVRIFFANWSRTDGWARIRLNNPSNTLTGYFIKIYQSSQYGPVCNVWYINVAPSYFYNYNDHTYQVTKKASTPANFTCKLCASTYEYTDLYICGMAYMYGPIRVEIYADNTGHPIDPIREGLIKRNEIIMGSGTIPTYTQRNVVLS